MNIVNAFWALFAFVINAVLVYVLYTVIGVLNTTIFATDATLYMIVNFGLWGTILILLFVVPASIAVDDEGRIRKMYAGAVQRVRTAG